MDAFDARLHDDVLPAFGLGGATATRHGIGHINTTWRVDTPGGPVLAQRLNPCVFPNARAAMRNAVAVADFLAAHPGAVAVPPFLRTPEGRSWVEADGALWRMQRFVAGTARAKVTTDDEAYAAARAFGAFQAALADYDGPPLAEHLPGFHDTPRRLQAFEAAVQADRAGRADACRDEIDALLERRAHAFALADEALPTRIAHNDAKVGNVLFGDDGTVVAVVDLDTTMPGASLADFGDLARSASGTGDEDDPDAVAFLPARYAALSDGYLDAAGPLLTPPERRLLGAAAQTITYEQALRFLADHLDGDRYYAVDGPGHNLRRARAQLRLLDGMAAAGI